MIVLDTNVVSEPLKLRPNQQVIKWLDAQAPQSLYVTAISLAELYAGLAAMPMGKRRTNLQAALGDSIATLFEDRILLFDHGAARAFASVSAVTDKRGCPMSFADTAIAAITAQHEFILATRNQTDFVNAGIELINPWELE